MSASRATLSHRGVPHPERNDIMTPTAPVRVARLTALFVGVLGVVVAQPLSQTDGTLTAAHHRPAVSAHGPAHASAASARAQADRAYGRLPLSFESNVGQTDASVDFMARGKGYALFLTAGAAPRSCWHEEGLRQQPPLHAIRHARSGAPRPAHPSPPGCLEPPAPTPSPQAVLRLSLPGASSGTRGHGEDPLPGKVHYLTGSNRAAWRSNVGGLRADPVLHHRWIADLAREPGRSAHHQPLSPAASS